MRFISKTFIYLLLILAVFHTTAFAGNHEDFHRKIDAGGVDYFEIQSVNGKVEIESWDGDEIVINAVKRTSGSRADLDRVEIEIDTGSTVTVRTVKQGHDSCDGNNSIFKSLFRGVFHGGKSVSVDYEVRLPNTIALNHAKSTNGYVEVRDVHGRMELKSTNGNIRAENASGEIEAHTTNGAIYVSGNSDVVSAHTTNGKIDVTLPDRLERDVRLRTTNGSVTLYVDPDVDARLKCRTTNGRISATGFKMVLDNISKRAIDATLGDGGYLIEATTTNGGISILQK